ncbi:MAG: c-type cytochrome, partial [Hyphomicrobiaceae bacterium]
MDSFEFNKIAGGVLTALLFMFGLPEIVHILGGGEGHVEHKANAGYTLPMPKGGEGGASSGPAKPEFSFATVAGLMPKASPDAGKDIFKACHACHTSEKGGPNKTGPNLFGIVGRPIGKHGGFNYSSAFADHGGNWTWEHLAHYLHKPKEYIPGNKMSYAGVHSEQDLADL